LTTVTSTKVRPFPRVESDIARSRLRKQVRNVSFASDLERLEGRR
jgi:hypothetical protein